MRVSVKVLGLNKSEVYLGDHTVVLFSYQTPVAAVHKDVYYGTVKRYSVTTSKHVSQWRAPAHKENKQATEEFLAELIASAVMEEHTGDIIEALRVLRAALVPHMGALPDIIMHKLNEALGLISVDKEGE